jgi:hypothetical protein
MNAVAAPAPANPIAHVDTARRSPSTWLTPASFEQAMQIAELMAKCGTLPDHLKGKPADCFRIVVQAAKWQMDPFAVAECTSLVYGRMCYEGKLVAAVLTSMGAIEGRLDYEISGSGQDASIVVTGTPRGGKPQSIKGTVKEWRTPPAVKEGRTIPNAWDKQPETQLVYRGTRQWARIWAPEAVLGVATPDEVETIREVQGEVVPDAPMARARELPPEKAEAPKEEPKAPAPPSPATVATISAAADQLYKDHKEAALAELKALNAALGIKTIRDCPPEKVEEAAKTLGEIRARLATAKKGA